ncbi:phage tail protein [Salmonella enterica subsp. enterica serovar Altendorf]|uniref:phage tail protein n=1 Tax=Salmonella enterica TaxID=28901 RepID=UPI000BA0DCFC|nr:phage tail protein [Salmonella enterica]OZU14092.1 phage tail protein [Salmonella enterica subsp. enterica serovar Altendorf]
MMATLGLFVFVLQTAPYQQMQQEVSWRHVTNSRVGQRPATQFLGVDEETITLSGELYPELTGGTLSLMTLQWMADTGKAWPLIEGTGFIYGMFVITSLSRTRTFFSPNGHASKIKFTLTLKRVDSNLKELFGDLGAQLEQIRDGITDTAGKALDAAKTTAIDAVIKGAKFISGG